MLQGSLIKLQQTEFVHTRQTQLKLLAYLPFVEAILIPALKHHPITTVGLAREFLCTAQEQWALPSILLA